MRKKITGLLLILGCIFTLNASAETKSSPFNVMPFEVPLKYKELLSKYRSGWQRLTGFEHSGLHWNQFIVIYTNKNSKIYKHNYKEYIKFFQDFDENSEDDEDGEPSFRKYFPGTVILKENYGITNGSPGQPISVTMMIKHKQGYDSKNGDWQYVQFDVNGTILIDGNSSDKNVNKLCASCHINMQERDFIFSNFFSNIKK